MALKKEQKDKLVALGIDIDAIIAAHNDAAEKDIVVPEGTFFTDAKLAERDAVKIAVGRTEENTAVTAALKKEAKTRLNIELPDGRIGDMVQAIGTKLSEIGGDEKNKALTTQVTALLADKEALTGQISKAEAKAKRIEFEFGQYSKFPPTKDDGLKPDERMLIMQRRGIEIKEDGVYKDGEPYVDGQSHANLPHDKAYVEVWKELKWEPDATGGRSGGRGGSNSNGGGAGAKAVKLSEAMENFKAANPSASEFSMEANDYVQAQAAGNPNFNFNE